MAKRKTYYMHTINDQPASFQKQGRGGGQIDYGFGSAGTRRIRLRSTLRQIRRDQRATKKFREDRGWDYDEFEYDYVRVVLPEEGE